VPEPEQLEHTAESENSKGHGQSFAVQHYSVSGDVQEAQEGLAAAARHYQRSAQAYVDAAQAWVERATGASAPDAQTVRARAGADYGFAASVYWYAGRSFADAYDFEHAGEGMEAAAQAYVAQARIWEEDGRTQPAATLRVEAAFRYLDAQRYYQQASDFRRNLANNLAAVGERQSAAEEQTQADELERRAVAAGLSVNQQGPEYHAAYQSDYKGANKSAYK